MDRRIKVVLAANFVAVAARMSLVTFLGIWFVREAHIPLATVGLAFLCEFLLRGAVAPLFGALSDRVGRRPVYAAGAAGAAIWACVFFPLLDTARPAVIVFAVVVALATHAAMYGPQAAFVAELFSTRLRYSGASMGYQVAGIFGGALAPIIAVKLVQETGSALSVSAYVVAMLAITGVALWLAPETALVPSAPVEDHAHRSSVPENV